jgi:hypothetical protein
VDRSLEERTNDEELVPRCDGRRNHSGLCLAELVVDYEGFFCVVLKWYWLR